MSTNSHIVAKFLSENSGIGASELAQATGLTRAQIENALDHLMTRGVVKSIPKRYELTAKGIEDLQRPNGFLSVPGMGKRRRRRPAKAEVQRSASSIVGFAQANRHPLDMAWGAAA